MRGFNFKRVSKGQDDQGAEEHEKETKETKESAAAAPTSELKMTREDIRELRDNILNIDPLSSSKTRSLAVNSNNGRNSVIETNVN